MTEQACRVLISCRRRKNSENGPCNWPIRRAGRNNRALPMDHREPMLPGDELPQSLRVVFIQCVLVFINGAVTIEVDRQSLAASASMVLWRVFLEPSRPIPRHAHPMAAAGFFAAVFAVKKPGQDAGRHGHLRSLQFFDRRCRLAFLNFGGPISPECGSQQTVDGGSSR